MQRKKILLAGAAMALFGLGLTGINSVSASGWPAFGRAAIDPGKFVSMRQADFQEQADLLGISVDQVKAAWAEGKSIRELAKELNIDRAQLQQKMQQRRQEEMKSGLQLLVSNGVITQAQADQRLKFMSQHKGPMRGHGIRPGMERNGFVESSDK